MGSYARIDWASEKHDVLIADETVRSCWRRRSCTMNKGLSALCDALLRFEVEAGRDRAPDGLLVERLLEAGLRVLALHPNQVKAARDRFRASGGKSDRFDASCSASWRAPTATASGCWSPIPIRPRRCAR